MNVIEALKDNLCYIVVSLFVLLSLFGLLSSRVHVSLFFSFGFIRASLYIRFMYRLFA